MAAPASAEGTGLISAEEESRGVQIPLTYILTAGEKPKITLQQATRDGREDDVRMWLKRLPKHNKASVLDAMDSDGYTAMHYAAKFNRFKIMQLLVTSGATPDIATPDDKLTPLHFAARYIPRYYDEDALVQEQGGSESIVVTNLSSSRRAVQFLIKYCRVDVNCKDQYGITPLHLACSRGNQPAVEVLLAAPNVEIDIHDNNQDTPLHEACLVGDKYIVEKLLEKMKRDNIDLLTQNDEKQTPLHCACTEGHEDIVKLILQYGFHQRRELVTAQDNEYNTPLHLACGSGNDKIVHVLLLNGADIHAAKNEEISPLHLAARHGFLPVAKTLMNSGLDIINILDVYQQTPLHYAAEFNQCEMINFLLDKGADIEALDSDSYSPLLTAAGKGQVDAFKTLMDRGAAVDIVDKDSKSAVFVAAEANHVNILRVLVSNKTGAKLCRTVDSNYNTPLHVAAENGNILALKVLLGSSEIKLDQRNELGKTPMHLAAENGHVPVIREFIRHQADTVNDEDEDSNTPLHLACTNGHLTVAKVLIEASCDVEARNAVLWTPMDCAAAGGWEKLVKLLINSEAEIDPTDKSKVTPLHLACREGHLNVVNTLIKNGADITNRDQSDNNALDLAIENGHEDIAMAIIKSRRWREALKNVTESQFGWSTTPLRKLIRKMPEVAEEVFNRCTTTNATKDGTIRPDSKDYTVAFNYEFLEDFRDAESKTTKLHRALTRRFPKDDAKSEMSSEFGDEVRSEVKSEPDASLKTPTDKDLEAPDDVLQWMSKSSGFTTDWGPVGFKKSTHPLAIMVQSERIDLLKHPLVTSLLAYKWRKYGRYVYVGNLFIYIIFLVFLTSFALATLNPLSCTCQAVFDGKFGDFESNNTLCPDGRLDRAAFNMSGLSEDVLPDGEDCSVRDQEEIACGECQDLSGATEAFLYTAAVIIVIFGIVRLGMEFFQLLQVRLYYILDWVNWVEVTLFVCAIIFGWIFHSDCLCPREWQWQIGTIAVFLAWIDLIIFIRKLPLTGIYVVMFVDIFYTFCKMVILSLLLVIAFGIAFYMAFFEPSIGRTPFSTPARALVKTMTMTTGEFEYDSIFRQSSDPTDDEPPDLAFPPVSYILWIIFLILMPILLTNLLVGLAVDDIKGVQEAAVLKRLALQVELALSIEELFPNRLRRHFIIGVQEVVPNRNLSVWEKFRYSVWGGERFDSSENITNALSPPLLPIELVQQQNRTLMAEVDKMKSTVSDLAERNEFVETLLREMARKQGINPDTVE